MKRKLHGRNLHTCVTYCAVWQRFYFLERTLNRKNKRGREELKNSDKFCPILLLWIRFYIYSSAAYTSILYFPYLILNTYSLSCAQTSVPERSCNPPHRRVTAESEIRTRDLLLRSHDEAQLFFFFFWFTPRRPERTHYGTLVVNLCHSCGSQRCKMSVTKNWTSG